VEADAAIADELAAAARRDRQPARLLLADGRSIELRRSSASDGRLVLIYRMIADNGVQRINPTTPKEFWRVVEGTAAAASPA
jgi:hypothetical protein